MARDSGRRLYIQEVVTRDGFQSEGTFIPTSQKIAIIDRLSQCGLSKIEVTSFTSPKAIPALADASLTMRGIKRNADVVYTALIPNVRGAERALECGVGEMNLVMSISEAHNISNLRMSREDSFRQLSEIVGISTSHNIPVNISFSTAFGCPMEGDIDDAITFRWIERFAGLSIRGITLCDTTGMANPKQVARISEHVLRRFPNLEITMHFHNTRGMALANAAAAAEVGINRFDASLGGLGGCPYAPGATGNVCTEDLVHMFSEMGWETGVDLSLLLEVARQLPGLVGHDVPSQVLKAGPSSRRYPIPASVEKIRDSRVESEDPIKRGP